VLCPDPLSPSSSTSSVMKTPENADDDPEPVYEGDCQMEFTVCNCTTPV
jgi:hypothetical protein